jgi:hypothetical protein
MTSEGLKKLFGDYAEDARFQSWRKEEALGIQFIYACEYGTIWKFTPKEWWQLVTKVVRNNGGHDFVLSKALRSRPKHIVKGEDNKFYSSDPSMRCVNPLDWTLLDWTNELIPGRRSVRVIDQAADHASPEPDLLARPT